jgi:hypothetical protein
MPTDKMLIRLSFANEVKKHCGTEIDPTGAERPALKHNHWTFRLFTREASAAVRKHQ